MTDIENTVINSLTFYEKLNDSQKRAIADNISVKRLKQGYNVHSSSEECMGLIIVHSGELRVYMLSEDGREITLYRLFENDVCVLSASCVIESITFDVFIDAEEDSEIIIVNSGALNEIVSDNIYAECFMLKKATERFSEVMWVMQQILFFKADRRVAIFLIDEMNKTKSAMLNITHDKIARYIGSAREVVSRILKYFEREKIVKIHRGGLEVIDKTALMKLI